ncbi:hypothetical protein, partial [Micrococcus flavus]|uniref:hypothetical protein n=1 Tax=Micrococcus flavus TaxID=384602 RepID=UPI0039EEB77B
MTHQHQSDDQQTPAADEATPAATLPPEARPVPETLGQLLRKGEVDKEVYAVSRLAEDQEVAEGVREPKDP